MNNDYRMILACDRNWGIGKNNSLPWPYIAEDMKWFRDNTMGGTVVMGKNTWISIGRRPLPDRRNIILTHDPDFYEKEGYPTNTVFTNGPFDPLENRPIWIIGGLAVFKSFIDKCSRIYLTRIQGVYDCDVSYPELEGILKSQFGLIYRMDDGDVCNFTIYHRV